MKFSLATLILMVSLLCFDATFSQVSVEPGNRIDPTILLSVTSEGNGCTYYYSIQNGSAATQEIIHFFIISSTGTNTIVVGSPTNWRSARFSRSGMTTKWLATPRKKAEGYINAILPGKRQDGFSIQSNGLPGIVIWYCEGNHPLPSFPEGMAIDSIPGYTDLTPYGPGVVGTTVGPVALDEHISAVGLIDSLVSYKHRALALGWIDNKGISQSLDQKLDNAKTKIESGDSLVARNMLMAFLNEVEAQNGKHLSGEAYALLRYNAEYLLNTLLRNETDRDGKK